MAFISLGTIIKLLFLFYGFGKTTSFFDFYSDQNEMKRLMVNVKLPPINLALNINIDIFLLGHLLLLNIGQFAGLERILYYVRNGSPDVTAMSYVFLIEPSISQLHFTWLSRKKTPMPYTIRFDISSVPQSTIKPVLNISEFGEVPTVPTVFEVSFPCSSKDRTSVGLLVMYLNIGIVDNVTTKLTIKRRRICQKEAMENIGIAIFDPNKEGNSMPHKPGQEGFSIHSSDRIHYVATGCSSALIILIAIGLTLYYRFTKRRYLRAGHPIVKPNLLTINLDNNTDECLYSDNNQSKMETKSIISGYTSGSLPSHQPGTSPIVNRRVTDPRDILMEIQVPRDRVRLMDILISGTFGRVFRGTLKQSRIGGTVKEILVKTVTGDISPEQVSVMIADGCLLAGLQHQNINAIIAACPAIYGDPTSFPWLIYPATDMGNLKLFLQKCRSTDTKSRYGLSTQQLVLISLQLIRGVQYLHRKKVIHKDIATRNCVITIQMELHLSDGALSRDLFSEDYQCLGDNENRPVKWLSVEALVERKFSPSSEVWAIGVTLWELITRAQQPYPDIDPFEMPLYLRDGFRMQQPLNCPDQLFDIMASCWKACPSDRPSMSELHSVLKDFHMAVTDFI